MGLSIILTTLLSTLTSPDLCADVYTDATGMPYTDAVGQTWSRFCEWTGPGAPVLDHDVCCTISGDRATCTLPDINGRCVSASKMYCEHGEVASTGVVVCYQPFPSICDFGFCGDLLPPGSGPLENSLCCSDGVCTEIEDSADIDACNAIGGISGYCKNGALNVDGTVDCFDE